MAKKRLAVDGWRIGWTGAVLCFLACAAYAQSLQVIELKHRTAEEVIPILQPLLESGGALSGKDYQLFVRASAANVKQLRSALAAIDKQPRQLLISVKRSTRAEMERQSVSAAATLRSGDAAVAVNERARPGSSVTVRGTDSSVQQQANGVSSVRVIEGSAAFIATGETVPVVTAIAGYDRRGPWVAGAATYRDLRSGFLATPRVSGERLILQIEQQNQQRGNNGQIQTQQLTTEISGALGQWLQLGGVEESASVQRSGIAQRRFETRSDTQSIWVKVELLQ